MFALLGASSVMLGAFAACSGFSSDDSATGGDGGDGGDAALNEASVDGPGNPEDAQADVVTDAGLRLRTFVTSTTYPGNVALADNLCQSLATTAMLGGQWRAWLSTDSDPGSSALWKLAASNPSGRWYSHDRTLTVLVVPDGGPDPDGGPLALVNPIRWDEAGGLLDGGTNSVWTGTRANGLGGAKGASAADSKNCYGWTRFDGTSRGIAGTIGGGPGTWTDDGQLSAHNCDMLFRLYCFEVPAL